jgi:hypothetical protein
MRYSTVIPIALADLFSLPVLALPDFSSFASWVWVNR